MVETKVLGERMDECSLVVGHWLEAETFLVFVGGKDAKLALLCLRPLDTFCKHGQSLIGIGNMIVLESSRIDVECHG